MTTHPELEAEQSYMDHAFACLEETRRKVAAMRESTADGRGGTYQNRFERDVIWEQVAQRLQQLELGERSLIFGRVDSEPDGSGEGSTYYIGRIAVSDERSNPVVVDWRAPVAESFYRATGRDPMGLRRRRHFATRGRVLVDIDDELFGSATAALDEGRVQGHGALITALEDSRSGKLSDIVGTIQAEQDRIIRSELPGALVVQGGPGTGKTVVALHRAAYLLYSHRFPLEGQGVLVVGPNRVFLSYIEQVLPALGEAGVEIAVLGDLVPNARTTGRDPAEVGRIKGDIGMVKVVRRALRDRQRALRDPLRVAYGIQSLVMTVEDSRRIVENVRRRVRTHNAGRRLVEAMVYEALHATVRNDDSVETVRDRTRRDPAVREALERMWPVLTPAELLNDLFGSPGLLRSAAERTFGPSWRLLRRERGSDVSRVVFTADDVPLLDEALELLGPRPRHVDTDMVRTYGHIVVDEAQDLSPMALRMLDRRSLNGSYTIVGDMAQATGAWPHDDWASVLQFLPEKRPPRREELTVGYRVPGPIMELASRVLTLAAPDLKPPTSIRHSGDEPRFVATTAEDLGPSLAAAVRSEIELIGTGNVAVIVPDTMVDQVDDALTAEGVDHGGAARQGLDFQVTVVPASIAKGLELDSVVVVEPGRILEEDTRGAQLLYVALTRSTKRLVLLHTGELPEVLRG